MKKLLIFLSLCLFLSSCTISCVRNDNLNDHIGSIVNKIENDSVGTINSYRVWITEPNSHHRIIRISPDYITFIAVGDTI